MKRFILLVIIALLALAVLLFLFNPELLEKIWLWIIGLIGVITSAIKGLVDSIKSFFADDSKKKNQKENNDYKEEDSASGNDKSDRVLETRKLKSELESAQEKINGLELEVSQLEGLLAATGESDPFDGTTLTVLRYFDDKETTLGLFFIDNVFFCYTLEDTYRKVKIKGKTRIPAGTYTVDFNRSDTPLTIKYRKTRPWFHYHLHVKNVVGFTGIYIHSGSTHEHTEGCLLVANSITSSDTKRMIYNSKVTFEELYKRLKIKLDGGEKIRIRYFDEDFLNHSILKNKAS